MQTHYYVSNSLCYAKGNSIDGALALLEVIHFPNSGKEMPVSIIEVRQPIDVPYAISMFLPDRVSMVLLQQDYESNIPLNELCYMEDGIVYFGEAA